MNRKPIRRDGGIVVCPVSLSNVPTRSKMSAPQQDPPVDLKRPYLAALLAFLVPGAGHLYQGRLFKAGIYFFGIMILFVWGMQIGEWKLLYRLDPMSQSDRLTDQGQAQTFDDIRNRWNEINQDSPSRNRSRLHWPYIAQAPVGMFSLIAFLQEERYYSPSNSRISPEFTGLEESAEGYLEYVDPEGTAHELRVAGTISLAVGTGDFGREIQGTFTGTTDDGRTVNIETSGEIQTDWPIAAEEHRRVFCRVSAVDGDAALGGKLDLFLERPWVDRFLVPPGPAEIQQLHGELGKKHTLAEVFTWIAGMLNVLAIWDAFAGPAYGYRLRRRKKTGDDEKTAESDADASQNADRAADPASPATA